eukprot:6020996-Pleurochrysis_carterae.AAC.2
MQPSFRQTFIEPLIHGFTKDVSTPAIRYHLMETTCLGNFSPTTHGYVVDTICSYNIPHSLKPIFSFNGDSIQEFWSEYLEVFFEGLQDALRHFAFTGDLNYLDDGRVFPIFDWYKFEVLPAPKRLSFDSKSAE